MGLLSGLFGFSRSRASEPEFKYVHQELDHHGPGVDTLELWEPDGVIDLSDGSYDTFGDLLKTFRESYTEYKDRTLYWVCPEVTVEDMERHEQRTSHYRS